MRSVMPTRGHTLSVTAADYAWWAQWRPDWAEAHCVTLVSDATAEEVVTSLSGDPVTRVRGIDALYERAVDNWPGGYDPSHAAVGVADAGHGWALIAEINGYVGVTERLIGPMAPGRTIVSHFRNINAAYRFHWWRDGWLVVDFDLLFPMERFGSDPDAVVDDIRGVGVPLDEPPEDFAAVDLGAAGFALAERITGVVCTPELFERSDFLVAAVEVPGSQEQQRYGEALWKTWHSPTAW